MMKHDVIDAAEDDEKGERERVVGMEHLVINHKRYITICILYVKNKNIMFNVCDVVLWNHFTCHLAA